MFYGVRILNKPYLEFSGFRVRHFKNGGRQYKCHNIYTKKYTKMSSNVDDIE